MVRLLLFEQHGVELLVGLNDQKLHGEEVRVLELLRDLGHLCAYAKVSAWEPTVLNGRKVSPRTLLTEKYPKYAHPRAVSSR